jgi:hypothetical protein
LKLCPGCLVEKPEDEFGRNSSRGDGMAFYCRDCFRELSKASYRRRAKRAGRQVLERRSPVLAPGFRRCPKCGEAKAEEEFPRNRSKSSGLGTYCKPCHNETTRSNIAKNHGNTRHYHLKRRYGMGADEVLEMLNRQWWHCPICVCRLTLETAHVDHDHRTGQVRAVLCFNCNGGLGQFRDDPRVLRRAADYLEGSEWQQTKPEPGGAYPRPISLPDPRPSPSSSAPMPPIFSLEGVRRLRPH